MLIPPSCEEGASANHSPLVNSPKTQLCRQLRGMRLSCFLASKSTDERKTSSKNRLIKKVLVDVLIVKSRAKKISLFFLFNQGLIILIL